MQMDSNGIIIVSDTRYPLGLKNLGRVWHAYIRSSGRFHMQQFISVDSGHFTQPELVLNMKIQTIKVWKGLK